MQTKCFTCGRLYDVTPDIISRKLECECGNKFLIKSHIINNQQYAPTETNRQEEVISPTLNNNNANAMVLGLIGSAVMFISIFLPIVRVPFLGSINYFQNGKGDGVFILVFAVISLILSLTNNCKWLWFTSLLSIGTIGFTLINFNSKMSELKSNNMFGKMVQLEFGLPILVVGIILLISSACIPTHKGN